MVSDDSPRRHSRQDVARTALRLLDDVGLPDLTMRRLAAALGVQPSALYHHFPDKQTLLAAVADRILAVHGAPVTADAWPDAVRAEAERLRDRLLAYRDGAEVVASTLSLGLGAGAARDRLEAAVARGGFDATTARRAATTLLHFVLGHVSHEQQRLQYDSLGVVAAPAEPDADQAETFRFGVGLLVAGLAARRPSPCPAIARVPSET